MALCIAFPSNLPGHKVCQVTGQTLEDSVSQKLTQKQHRRDGPETQKYQSPGFDNYATIGGSETSLSDELYIEIK